MNIGIDFRGGLQRLPGLLENMTARINTLWNKEHKTDGSHKHITAHSVTVTPIPPSTSAIVANGTVKATDDITTDGDLGVKGDTAVGGALSVWGKITGYGGIWVQGLIDLGEVWAAKVIFKNGPGGTGPSPWHMGETGAAYDALEIHTHPPGVSSGGMAVVFRLQRDGTLIATALKTTNLYVANIWANGAAHIALKSNVVADGRVDAQYLKAAVDLNVDRNASIAGTLWLGALATQDGTIELTGNLTTGGQLTAETLAANTLTHNGLGWINVPTGVNVNQNLVVGTTLNVGGVANFASAVNCHYVEATAHIRAATGLYAGAHAYITGDVHATGWFKAPTGTGFIFDGNAGLGVHRSGDTQMYYQNNAPHLFLVNGSLFAAITTEPSLGWGLRTGQLSPLSDGTCWNGYVNGARWLGGAFVNTPSIGSDGRDKEILGEEPLGLDFVNRLRPVAYRWRVDKRDETRRGPQRRTKHGFVAQELEETLKTLGVEFDGLEVPATPEGRYGLAYTELLAPMVKAMQEMSAKIEDLTARVAALEAA